MRSFKFDKRAFGARCVTNSCLLPTLFCFGDCLLISVEDREINAKRQAKSGLALAGLTTRRRANAEVRILLCDLQPQ